MNGWIEEYIRAGVRLVWVISPLNHTVRVYRADGSSGSLREENELDGEDVLPGFRCPVLATCSHVRPSRRPTATRSRPLTSSPGALPKGPTMTHPVLVAVPVLAMILFAALPASAAESRQKQFTDCDAKAKELLSRMTLDEKIGQMIQHDKGSLKDPADVEKY